MARGISLKNILSIVGKILFLLALVQIIPLILAYYYHEPMLPFAVSILVSGVFGLIFGYYTKDNESEWTVRESYAIVALSWLFSAVFCAIPFLLSGLSPFDAFFEAMSGVTTTGATILTEIDIWPKSLLFWRSLTQWLGGLGVVALFLAVIPKVNMRGRQLYKMEFSGPTEGKISPKISSTAKILWYFYIGATILLAVILFVFEFPVYDAAIFALSTMSSGGFAPYDTSILPFMNFKTEIIIIIFMLIAGTNFALIYKAATKGIRYLTKDEEFRTYIFFFLIVSAVLTVILIRDMGYDPLTSIRYAFFQISSIMTTTGFVIVDYNLWSDAAKIILLLAMFSGGCSGSTAGGPTFVRWIILLRHARRDVFKFLHPNAVKPIKYNGRSLNEEVVNSTISFMILYLLAFVISTVLLGILELDLITAATTSIGTLGNIGPIFGMISPFDSFTEFPVLARVIMIANMWIGRLEIYTVILLFTREFWKR
ncbi:Trk system potassium uptake protein TrkH [Methanimicrococcus sp. At1]|uniref:Trk system potassium uptake protein TrkH n=1 Tax=Methanimicrococcus hacksteinii TaxID=3028293 RepID=A0ABU3VMC8_9EURY|nr:TrkH family potassium uptake protein [Methanimicrococcus sp. At1]MDV0444557.1 Trk system potassium uptake protein TrkH [Methanimicrococcus sp. At1]